jgi:hypothetical protein
MLANEYLEKQKHELSEKLENLQKTLPQTRTIRWGSTSLIKTLSSHVCDKKIRFLLENDSFEENKKFDPYYVEKSKYATNVIIDSVKTKLITNRIGAIIQTEKIDKFGRYDIFIKGSEDDKKSEREEIRIEVKASIGIDLEQITRYLWSSSTLILARVMTKQVTEFNPFTLMAFAASSIKRITTKVDRMLKGEFFTVQGSDCKYCPDTMCQHNRQTKQNLTYLVTIPDKEFGEDLNLFFSNLRYVSEKVSDIVVSKYSRLLNANSNLQTTATNEVMTNL